MTKRWGAIFASGVLLGAAAVAGVRKKPAPGFPPAPEPKPKPETPKEQDTRKHPLHYRPNHYRTNALPPQPQPQPPPFMRDEPKVTAPPPASPSPPPAAPQPEASAAGRLVIYAAGLVLVVTAAATAWIAWGDALMPLLATSETVSRTAAAPATTPPQPARPVPQHATACPTLASVAAANEKDGKFPQHADVSSLIEADIVSFSVLGKESAAAGRPRDAEAAFLMSCRVADELKGADSTETADAKYQLGSHYVQVALDQKSAAGTDRTELLKLAEFLYADSLRAYSANYGEGHEKTRLASEGLAQLRQTLAQAHAQTQVQPPADTPTKAPAVPIAPTTNTALGQGKPAEESTASAAQTAPPQPLPRAAEVAKAAPPPTKKTEASTQTWPSFDCKKARSISEVIICSDAELAQQDRELGRLYARAKIAASDSAAFRRQQEDEWRLRESICRERECLRRWYAQRRVQLLAVIAGQT